MTPEERDAMLAEIEQKMGRQFVEDLRAVAASLKMNPPGSPEAQAAVARAAMMYFSLDSEDQDRLVVVLPALKGAS